MISGFTSISKGIANVSCNDEKCEYQDDQRFAMHVYNSSVNNIANNLYTSTFGMDRTTLCHSNY